MGFVRVSSIVALSALMAACGGGGGGKESASPPNQAPQAAFTASVATGPSPLDVAFDASASADPDGTIASYAWDFGDGATATGPVVQHRFANPGDAPIDFTVTLQVIDDDGASAAAIQLIAVAPGAIPPTGVAAPIAVECTHTGEGIEYNIHPTDPVVVAGPVRTLRNIGDLDWATLAAGDTVRIHPRLDPVTDAVLPYRERIGVSTSGTAEQPIRVCGVPTPDGRLPYISGDGATAAGVSGTGRAFGANGPNSMQPFAIVLVRGPQFGARAEHVIIEGLHVADTHREGRVVDGVSERYTYVDALDGSVKDWSHGAACIRLQRAAFVTVRGNVVRNCGNGLFTLSQTYEGEASVVDGVHVVGNYFIANSVIGRDREHQNYLQGTNFLVEFNYFAPTRVSDDGAIAGGSQLKMRTAGEVIRYNYFGNNRGRALDLVDVEDHTDTVFPWRFNHFFARNHGAAGQGCTGSAPTTCLDPAKVAERWAAYQNTYVYGNIFDLTTPYAPLSAVHYGNDNCPQHRRPGSLWFYHNTVSFRIDRGPGVAINNLFDIGGWTGDSCGANPNLGVVNNLPDDPPGTYYIVDGVSYGQMLFNDPTDFAMARAHNNVVHLATNTDGALRAAFSWTRYLPDRAFIGRNWVSDGWNAAVSAAGNSGVSSVCGAPLIPGFGLRCGQGPMFTGGNDHHHVVVAASGFLTGTPGVTPIEVPGTGHGDFRPVAGGALALPGAVAPALPGEIPVALRPTFQIFANPDEPGRLIIEARGTSNTLGAIE